jgi:hypothetical protein
MVEPRAAVARGLPAPQFGDLHSDYVLARLWSKPLGRPLSIRRSRICSARRRSRPRRICSGHSYATRLLRVGVKTCAEAPRSRVGVHQHQHLCSDRRRRAQRVGGGRLPGAPDGQQLFTHGWFLSASGIAVTGSTIQRSPGVNPTSANTQRANTQMVTNRLPSSHPDRLPPAVGHSLAETHSVPAKLQAHSSRVVTDQREQNHPYTRLRSGAPRLDRPMKARIVGSEANARFAPHRARWTKLTSLLHSNRLLSSLEYGQAIWSKAQTIQSPSH